MAENRRSKPHSRQIAPFASDNSATPAIPGDLMEIGRIVKAHGIRGELSLDYDAESPDLLKGFVWLKAPSGPIGPGGLSASTSKRRVKSVRMHKGRPLLVLEGVDDRNQAELLRNFLVLIPQSRLPELSADEIYLSELPGLAVYLHPDYDAQSASLSEDRRPKAPLGRLDSVADVAGQEIWTIVTPDGREILLPANEEFVRSIDLEHKRAEICPPPGLLEIYLN